jgi:chitinase
MGRCLTLCIRPGCPFSGASKPGPCTGTGGILSYYEIQDILKQEEVQKRAISRLHHDQAAAVKYFTFDHDQWISFDDEETFKQKTDWATEIGFGGALIWASDLGMSMLFTHSEKTLLPFRIF